MKKKTSIKDIAQKCHVSVSTVSKALNNREDVSKEKKDEICKVAREMNYIPSYLVSTLKSSKRPRLIGVLLATGTGLMHEYFAKVLNSFKTTIEERGYILVLLNASDSPNRLTFAEQSQRMNLDGIFILCADFGQIEVQNLLNINIPLVTADNIVPGHISVMSNQYGDMTRLLQLIYERGHKKIAYIHGENSEVTKKRVDAYKNFLKEHNLTYRKEYLYTCPYRDTEKVEALTKIILKISDPPTCILYPDDLTAITGIFVMKENDTLVPRDISVAGYDGISMMNIVSPRLTTIRQDTISMGIQAGNHLVNKIEFPDTKTGNESIWVDGMVEPGESVRMII